MTGIMRKVLTDESLALTPCHFMNKGICFLLWKKNVDEQLAMLKWGE